MSDSPKAALAASIAGGYLLGRSGKAKLALTVAAYLASNRLRAKPQELLASGAGRLSESPEVSKLIDQLRSEVLTVGRQALKAAADRRLQSFADSLADRTKSMGELVDAAAEESKGGQDEEDTEESEGRQDDEEEQEEEEEEPERRRTGERAKSQSRKPSRPRRDTAQQAPPAKRAAKKTENRPARKAAKRAPAESSRRRR